MPCRCMKECRYSFTHHNPHTSWGKWSASHPGCPTLRKQPPVPNEQEAWWVQEPVSTLCRREKSLVPAGNLTIIPQPSSFQLNNYTMIKTTFVLQFLVHISNYKFYCYTLNSLKNKICKYCNYFIHFLHSILVPLSSNNITKV